MNNSIKRKYRDKANYNPSKSLTLDKLQLNVLRNKYSSPKNKDQRSPIHKSPANWPDGKVVDQQDGRQNREAAERIEEDKLDLSNEDLKSTLP